MAALTRDLHVFASRVTTGFSAVFFSVRYIAQARYVRALPHHLIRHFGSFLSGSLIRSLPHRNPRRSPVGYSNPGACGKLSHSRPSVFGGFLISTDSMQISKLRLVGECGFGRISRSAVKFNKVSSVGRRIARRYADGLVVVSLLIEVKFD
jgi:hypothetical protein